MKTKIAWKVLIVSIVCMTMPISQVLAVAPDVPPALFNQSFSTSTVDVSEETNFDGGNGFIPGSPLNDIVRDILEPAHTSGKVSDAVLNEDEKPLEVLNPAELEMEIREQILSSKTGHRFWNRRNIVITSAILLAAGLLVGLLVLLSGGGSGSGSGNGNSSGDGGTAAVVGGGGAGGGVGGGLGGSFDGGAGGGGFGGGAGGSGGVSGGSSLPSIPHHPEPSTFLLLGLGLLMPFLRKRNS